jgi:mono/diheme cytochrome c family protein
VVIALLAGLALLFQDPAGPGLGSSRLPPEVKGQILIEELNCAACHGGGGDLSARSRKAPRLADLASRVNPHYLETFLRDPQGAKPGTAMPDLLRGLDAAERGAAAAALSHYLRSLKAGDFAPEAPDTVAAEHGARLFHARGCVACHAPRDEAGVERPAATSVPLGALEGKYSVRSLSEFLRRPHASRPSGRMPDLRLQGREPERIAHYLLQKTRVPGVLRYTLYRGDVWEGLGGEKVVPERSGHVKEFTLESLGKPSQHTAIRYEGWLRVETAGPHTFHLRANGGSLILDGSSVLRQDPSPRRGVMELRGSADLAAGWRRIELVYFHTGRKPEFLFEMETPGQTRRPIPPAALSVSPEPIPAFAPPPVDPAAAVRGKELFGRLGCANCHDDLGVPPRPGPALASLDPGRGCLGGTDGPWPRFALDAERRGWMAKALPGAAAFAPDDRLRLDKTLVALNCISCHERAGLGGIPAERKPFFTGTQPEMGDQGRLPPPLTLVGAKLKPEAIADVLLRGKRHRPYLEASMPQFGEANAGPLVEAFAKADSLEAVDLPPTADAAEAKKAGHHMIGTAGLSCISCHEFNGEKSGGIGALDLVGVTGRLQRNWFHLYLRDPARFHPLVIMPTYWPEGKAALKDLLGGDAGRQIEALWLYLEDGTRVKKPVGLARQSNELRVGDVPEICRGRSPVGYRGIGVGYPERIHLIFDSEELALRQIWKGEFTNVDLGSFQPRGTDRVLFPPGIPFHRLKSMDENWPYKGKSRHGFPQDHGYEFRGYHLDAARRPTFRYRYGDLAVEDRFDDLRDAGGKAYFRRTLTFEAPEDAAPFHFRAAAGKSAVRESGRVFRIDGLRLDVSGGPDGSIREGEPAEVLIPLSPPKGRSVLTMEYRW